MKGFLNFLLVQICLFLSLHLQAQDTTSLEGKIRYLFEPLNKSEMATDILIQQTPFFLWPGIYDGIHVPDSLALSRSQWGMLYGQFRGASVGTSYLPDPHIYVNQAMAPHRFGQPVPLMFMATRFDMIRKGAVDDNLVYWQDGQCHDTPNRIENPYRQDTCFALAPVHQEVQGLEVTLVLPDSLLFTNLGWTIDSFEIDVDDGLGWRWAYPDQPFDVEYLEGGRVEILLRLTRNGTAFLALTWLQVEDSGQPSRWGENGPYNEENPETIDIGAAELSLFSSCSDGKIRKPLIAVEGFPNLNEAEKSLMQGLLRQEDSDLKNFLNTREYDIIWVDWKDNITGVAAAADKLIAVIEWVNNRKHADGSYEPNVLVGASFGGLVSKYALLKMHNLDGNDSEVGTFFTYDSPLKGANLPMGLQAFLVDLEAQLSSFGASSPEIQQALGLLKSPAPKDMLIGQVSYVVEQGVPALTYKVDGFQPLNDAIEAMESIQPINEITRFITLSNGADLGAVQSYLQPGENILSFILSLDEAVISDEPEICYNVHILAEAYAADQVTTHIYSRLIYIEVHCLFKPDELHHLDLYLSQPAGLDNAPGGNSNLGIKDIKTAIDEAIFDTPNTYNYHFSLLDGYSFIPTVSSLDMPLNTDRYTGNPQGGASVNRWSASQESTPLAWDANMLDYNQYHVSMNGRIANVIQTELEPGTVADISSPLQAGDTYNFGKNNPLGQDHVETPHFIDEDVTLVNGGALWINRFDRIGYTNSANPYNHKPQAFSVTVPGISCAGDELPVMVTVGNGSKILIGQKDQQTTNLGKLSFLPQSTLNVNEGGEVILAYGKDNQLVLHGGNMNISSGAFVDARWGSQIYVKEGSTLTVRSGGTLRISHSSQLHVEDKGHLILEPGAIVQLWDGQDPQGEATIHIHDGGELVWQGDIQFSGNGFFQFDDGHKFTVLSDWNLVGIGKGTRMVRLNENAKLKIEDLNISLKDGAVEYGVGTEIEHLNGETRLEDVEFYGTYIQSGMGLNDYYPTKVYVDNCHFDNLDWGYNVSVYQSGSSDFSVQNSLFTDCGWGFIASPANWIAVDQCTFEGCGTGMDFRQVKYAYINDCNVHGNVTNQDIGVFLEDVPVFRMQGGVLDGLDDGIQSLGGNQSNVFLYSQATVSNCDRGIYIEEGGFNSNGKDFGMVLMDCANLINNKEGIIGKDILLQVDAVSNATHHPNQMVTPNTFVNGADPVGLDDIFQICYDVRDASTVYARENVWGNGAPSDQYDFDNHDFGTGTNGCDFIYSKVDNIVWSPTAQYVVSCPLPPRSPGYVDNGGLTAPPIFVSTETCSVGGSNSLVVHDQWARGLDRFYAEDLDGASSFLDPIAGIQNEVRDTLSQPCRHYIDVARVLVDAINTVEENPMANNTPESNGLVKNTTNGDLDRTDDIQIQIAPNPARESINIHVEGAEDSSYRIVSALGLLMDQGQTRDTWSLNVQGWPEGMYEIQVMSQGSRFFQNERFMVVK